MTLRSLAETERLARLLNADPAEEGWRYVAVNLGNNRARLDVFDEDDCRVGSL